MIAVESASVPSQSKTSSRNRRAGAGPASGIAAVSGLERGNEARQILRQRRLEVEAARPYRMRHAEAPGVEEHALQASLRQRLVPGEVAVLVVARQREAEVREVHPDLVGAARVELRFQQAHRRLGLRPYLPAAKHRARGLAAKLLDAHAPLAGSGH